MSNFAMETILGKGFPQAQVHTEFIAQVPKAQVFVENPFPKLCSMRKLHSLILLAFIMYYSVLLLMHI
jgi:hypothetical protein